MDLVRDLPKCIHKHLLKNKRSTLANEFREVKFLTLDCQWLCYASSFRCHRMRALCKLSEAGKKWPVSLVHLFHGRLAKCFSRAGFIGKNIRVGWLLSQTSIKHKWLFYLYGGVGVRGLPFCISIFMKLKSFHREYFKRRH